MVRAEHPPSSSQQKPVPSFSDPGLQYMVQRRPEKGPSFQFTKSRFLTREHLVSVMRVALQQTGIDVWRYAGHTFRIGAATTAAQGGQPDSWIKILGRWEV